MCLRHSPTIILALMQATNGTEGSKPSRRRSEEIRCAMPSATTAHTFRPIRSRRPGLSLRWCCDRVRRRDFALAFLGAGRCQPSRQACDYLGAIAGKKRKEASQAGHVFAPRVSTDLRTEVSDRAIDRQVGPESLKRVAGCESFSSSVLCVPAIAPSVCERSSSGCLSW